MLTKRIIACLDVKDGRVVKGVNFLDLVDMGNPVVCAEMYDNLNADELVFLDITASSDNRKIMVDLIKNIAKKVFIPLTVGGGIKNIGDIREILQAGADKISVNSAAVKNPDLINQGAEIFGSQCILVAIDAKKENNGFKVYINGGRIRTDLDVISWAREAEKRGAGEILITSMDKDGTRNGYDIELTRSVCESVNIPVIASGGAGKLEDFKEILEYADAALAAGLFHSGEIKISVLKDYLASNNISVRRI